MGAFRIIVYFDHEVASDTRAESVERCPGCARWLHALAIKPSDITSQRG